MRKALADKTGFGAMPGMSETVGDVCSDIRPAVRLGSKDRRAVVLTTGKITKENLFQNGLLQNIILFYRLFEAIGYEPYLMMNEIPSPADLPECLAGARIEDGASLTRKCLRIHAFIEVGMSIDTGAKRQLKMMGARLMKIYLGNIMNIDTEISLFCPSQSFPHHIGSGTDMILVSPHYGQNMEYAQALNGVPITAEPVIAPYVWDPSLIGATEKWRPGDGSETVVIMEPNISFQKAGVVPLLAMERWYRRNKGWSGKVVLMNSERLVQSHHFQLMYFKNFELFKDKKVELHGRRELRDVLRMFPSAVFLAHQVNNEFNYMMLELFSAGFPVVHNVDSWCDFGYSYSGADLDGAATAVRDAFAHHAERRETYRSHAAALAWRYSLYNPAVQAAWKALLD
jgi:Protein of unknown function (DUF2827)